MADLHHMLDGVPLHLVLGAALVPKGPWEGTFFYREALLFIPRGLAWPGKPVGAGRGAKRHCPGNR
jgi:hypothetical protein